MFIQTSIILSLFCEFNPFYLNSSSENWPRSFSTHESILYVCRIGIDEWLRVPSVPDVFAIGDCCGYLESTGKSTLPALAQVSASYPLLLLYLQSYGYMHICKSWVFTETTSLSLWGISAYILPPDPTSV